VLYVRILAQVTVPLPSVLQIRFADPCGSGSTTLPESPSRKEPRTIIGTGIVNFKFFDENLDLDPDPNLMNINHWY
jgi:hypothetical protein